MGLPVSAGQFQHFCGGSAGELLERSVRSDAERDYRGIKGGQVVGQTDDLGLRIEILASR